MSNEDHEQQLFPKPLADWDDTSDAAIRKLADDSRVTYTKVPRMAKNNMLAPESCDIIIENARQFLKHENVTQRQLGRMAGVKPTTLNELLASKYQGEPSKYCKKIDAAMNQHFRRVSSPELEHFVSTGVAKEVFAILRYTATVESAIGVVTANSGVGKSMALRAAVKSDFPNGLYIEVNAGQSSPLWFLRAILQCLRCGTSFAPRDRELGDERVWSRAAAFNKIVAMIADSRRLLVIDEAENLPPESINILRQILDKTKCSAVLAGRPPLAALIQNTTRRQSIGGSVLGRVVISRNLQGLYASPDDGRWMFNIDDIVEILNKFKIRFQPGAARWLCAMANISAMSDKRGLRSAINLFKMTVRLNKNAAVITTDMLGETLGLLCDRDEAVAMSAMIARHLKQADTKRRSAAG